MCHWGLAAMDSLKQGCSGEDDIIRKPSSVWACGSCKEKYLLVKGILIQFLPKHKCLPCHSSRDNDIIFKMSFYFKKYLLVLLGLNYWDEHIGYMFWVLVSIQMYDLLTFPPCSILPPLTNAYFPSYAEASKPSAIPQTHLPTCFVHRTFCCHVKHPCPDLVLNFHLLVLCFYV